ncbi:hypothetical protein ACX1C1_06155 [Paenibacillus sp. strain BS8-2]
MQRARDTEAANQSGNLQADSGEAAEPAIEVEESQENAQTE